MKMDQLIGERFKERPADCVADSHAILIKGGYMKYVANGIYSQYLPLRRICRKIEQIIREEMDGIDGQEVQFPMALPAALWEESGRYETVGSELLRFTDRNQAGMVLGMTHEEAAVQLVKDYGRSYLRYPFMIYQLQTKFRDEARPRAGLIRTREFTMKDAYSFHTSMDDLEQYYRKCFDAYHRIFARAGISEVVAVASDSGMMGGNLSHEYMLLTPAGEDTIAMCGHCDYRANREAAESVVINQCHESKEVLTKVSTPNLHTIEAVCGFLGKEPDQACKAVVYQRNDSDSYVTVFIRGDLDVNETKLTNYLGTDIHGAVITEESGICPGFTGPVGFTGSSDVLYDNSLKGAAGLICGANETGYHYTGLDMERDIGKAKYPDLAKIIDGGICPCCNHKTIRLHRGIEVGNIFQLGTKYTEAMDMKFTEADGSIRFPFMGCYGIGIGRLAASVCEARHDENGPVWPITIAPWQVHICCLRADEQAVKACADNLYSQLVTAGVEVLYDDRKISAGSMFADADLLGIPIRIIISPRNLKQAAAEVTTRDKTIRKMAALDTIGAEVNDLIKALKELM